MMIVMQILKRNARTGQPDAHERALGSAAIMVGSLLLARAVDEPAPSDALCQAALKHLTPT